jgi:hypothetical protein
LQRNQLQDGYQQVLARLLADQSYPYAARKLYVEFQNVNDPETDTVSPPVGFATSEGVEYYADLDSGSGIDYLRIDIASATPKLLSDYPGSVLNAVEYLGYASSSNVGELGTSFGYAHNSLVYGLALVACPEPNNPSADIIIGRKYYSAEDQKLCPVSGVMTVGYILIPVAA